MRKSKESNVVVEEKTEDKICKKCGEPLRRSSKHKYCENCRREKAKARREVAGVVGALGLACLSVVPGIKHFVKK